MEVDFGKRGGCTPPVVLPLESVFTSIKLDSSSGESEKGSIPPFSLHLDNRIRLEQMYPDGVITGSVRGVSPDSEHFNMFITPGRERSAPSVCWPGSANYL